MGVDSKVVVKSKYVLKVCQKVVENLNIWQRNEIKKEVEQSKYNHPFHLVINDKNWTIGVSVHGLDFKSWALRFRCGEHRSIFIYPDTDKISFILGSWGRFDEIMRVVADSCKDFGETKYRRTDSDEFEIIS